MEIILLGERVRSCFQAGGTAEARPLEAAAALHNSAPKRHFKCMHTTRIPSMNTQKHSISAAPAKKPPPTRVSIFSVGTF